MKKILRSAVWAAVAVALSFFTSNGISFYHQEASFAVVFFLPFIWYAWLRIKDTSLWFVPLCAMTGYLANIYYPQLYFCYAVSTVLALLLCWKSYGEGFRHRIKEVFRSPLIVTSGLMALLLTSLPAGYTYYKYWDKIGSPLRERDTELTAQTYPELVSMQSRFCNMHPGNILSYFGIGSYVKGSLDPQDSRSIFVGPAGIIGVLLFLFWKLRRGRFYFFVALFTATLSMGFYGFAPKLLWWWVPGMKMFRQYYHFIEIFNVQLIVFCAVLLKETYEQVRFSKAWKVAALTLILMWIGYANISWSLKTVEAYRKDFKDSLRAEEILAIKPFTPKEYAEELLLKQDYPYEAGKVKTLKPRGFNHEQNLHLWNAVGGVHFRTGNFVIPYRREDLSITVRNKAFEFEVLRAPANPNALEVLQYNDGNWLAFDEHGKTLEIKKDLAANIEIPNVVSGTRVLLKRRGSLWGIIVLVAFGSLVAALMFPLLVWKREELFQTMPRVPQPI